MVPALWGAAKTTWRALWRVIRQLFHETTGFLFAWFGVYGGLLAWRQWRERPEIWLVGLAVIYSAMMGAFSIGAFRRARRVR
jgi:hypothetical protein